MLLFSNDGLTLSKVTLKNPGGGEIRLSWFPHVPNQHIKMITEGSCDTEDEQ